MASGIHKIPWWLVDVGEDEPGCGLESSISGGHVADAPWGAVRAARSELIAYRCTLAAVACPGSSLNLLPFAVLFLVGVVGAAVAWRSRVIVNLTLSVLCVVCVLPVYAESREFCGSRPCPAMDSLCAVVL